MKFLNPARMAYPLLFLAVVSCSTKLAPKKDLTGAGPAVRMLLSGLSTIELNACVPYLVISQDTNGSSSAVASDVLLLLSSLNGGSFFADPSCGFPTTTALLPMGNSSALFYYKNTQVQSDTITVQASAGQLVGTSLAVTIDGPFQLSLSGPEDIKSDACRPYLVRVQNAAGNSRNAVTNVLVNLLGAGSGAFYSNAGCTTAITSVTVNAGTSFRSFFYKNSVVENVILEAEDDAGNLNPASLPVSIDGPTRLVVSGPAAVLRGSCGAYSVTSVNPAGTATAVGSDTTINLSDANAGQFFSDGNCNFPATSVALVSGASSVPFYYSNATVQNVTLTAADGGGILTSGSLAVAVDSASRLALSGPVNLGAGACGAYEIVSQNAVGQEIGVSVATTVTLTEIGSGSFYSDVDCTTAITSAVIPALASRKTIYFLDNVTEDATLTASAASFVSGSLTVSVAGASRLAVVGPTSIDVAECAAYQVQSQNGAGSATPVTANVTVNLTGGGLGIYYGDDQCTTPITQRALSNGSSAVPFYFKSTLPGTATLTASDSVGNLTSGSLTVTAATVLLAVLEISENPHFDFGDVTVNQSGDKTLTVSNTGDAPATDMKEAIGAALASPFDFKGGSYPGTGGTCGTALNQNDDCTIVVTFAPTATGDFTDVVTLSYDNGSAEVLVERELRGTGVPVGSGGGELDLTFGPNSNGKAVYTYGSQAILNAVSIRQSDGKIVVGGATKHPVYGDYEFALFRLKTDGTLDTSFGSGGSGLVLTDFRGGDDVILGMALQPDNKIVAVGYTRNSSGLDQSLALARYTANGVLDTSFSGDGMVHTRISNDNNDLANAVAIDSNGKIVVVGRAGSYMIFARYTSFGSLDAGNFGSTGIRSLSGVASYHSALALAIQSNGKIVATGYAADSSNSSAGVVVTRLNSDGTADASFDSDGYVVTAVSAGYDMGRGVAIQSDGKIVVVGTSYESSSGDYVLTVLRYGSTGALDTSFSGDGKVFHRVASGNSIAEGVRLDSSGRIVVVGYVDRTGDDLFVLARFTTAGTLDTSFGGDGIFTVSNGRGHAVALQSDGKIVAVGESLGAFAVIRVNP